MPEATRRPRARPRTATIVAGLLALPVLLPLTAPAAAQEGEAMATLALSFTNNGRPLNEHEQGKFYIHEPDDRKAYVDWGHADRTASAPPGTYDLVIRYENGEIEETITRKKIELKGAMRESIDFRVPVAHLTVEVTRGGSPIEPFTGSYSVFRSGQRDRPLVRKRPGTEITIRPGTYDIEVAHRGPDGMKTRWVEGVFVDGSTLESVELGLPRARLAQVTVTLQEDGRPVPPESGVWRVYNIGQRTAPLAERRSGEMLGLEKGIYDIGAFYSVDGSSRERWLTAVTLEGDIERQIEMGIPAALLRVNVNSRDRLVRNAWFSVYSPGQRDSPLLSARSGTEVELEPGTYDIGAFLRDGTARADQWLRNQAVQGPLTLELDLDFEEASLSVVPRERNWRRDKSGDPRLLIVVDSSDRMQKKMDGGTRLSVALPAIAEGLSALPSDMQVGLRTFGGEPQTELECRASSLRVPVHVPDAEALTDALARFRPLGAAPLAHALEEATADLSPGPENTLVLITSGADGCGGDLCAAASRLLLDGSVGRIFVIGFDLDRDQMRRLDCAGEQRSVGSGRELSAAIRDVIQKTAGAEDGTFSVFLNGRPTQWVAGGAVGDRVKVKAGVYHVQIHSRGRTYEWDDVELRGDIESPVGRRLRDP